MKIGKASSGRNNGIDQIWVKRNLQSGVVEEYIIVECKGSVDAELNEAKYGWQMSPCWAFHCLDWLAGEKRQSFQHIHDGCLRKNSHGDQNSQCIDQPWPTLGERPGHSTDDEISHRAQLNRTDRSWNL
ncbi:hypothetical protein [Pseudomonas sp. EA_15y_Pfl2_R67]